MKRFAFCVTWDDWSFSLAHMWYDGPFWQLWIGPFSFYWERGGLPYLFQEK